MRKKWIYRSHVLCFKIANIAFFAMKPTSLETLSFGEKIWSPTFFWFDASKCSINSLEVGKFWNFFKNAEKWRENEKKKWIHRSHVFCSKIANIDFFAMKPMSFETLSSGEKIWSPTFFWFGTSKCSKNGLEVGKFWSFFKKVEKMRKKWIYRSHFFCSKIANIHFFAMKPMSFETLSSGEEI